MDIEKEHIHLLFAIAASLFSTPLMMAGVNAILPELGASLDANARQLALVGAFYSLGLAIFQLAAGCLGDIQGHRRIFLASAIVFAVTSFLLGFTRLMPLFLFLRFAQGAAGAMLSACGLALVASIAPNDKRASYFGMTGAAVYAGIAMGPPIAGLVTAFAGWPWIFWLNAAALLGVFFLMKNTVAVEWRPAAGNSFDFRGCLLYAAAMSCLSVSCAKIVSETFVNILLFMAFVFFLIIFFYIERKTRFPLLNLELLARKPVFTLSALAAFVNYASFFGLIFYFSFYLQAAKGIGVRETGFILAVQPLAQALGTPFATRLCKRFSEGPVCSGGSLLCGIGLLAASFLQPESPLWQLFLAQIFIGFGISLFSLGNTTMMIESAGREHTGQASALTGAVRTAGQLCSMVAITLSLSWFLGNAAISSQVLPQFMASMKASLLAFAFANLLAIALTLFRNKKSREA